MKLIHLEIACYLYNQFTEYDNSYVNLIEKHPRIDLQDNLHIKSLLEWLRSWGCRQFKKDSEEISIRSIREWYNSRKTAIPNHNVHLIDYDLQKNNGLIIELFDDLANRKASIKDKGNKKIEVRIGPVGAAKTLFALRPNLFSPWDTPIYKKFKLNGDGSGYVLYLKKIQKELKDLKHNVDESKFKWEELFKYLGKRHNSYPKLIDEYYWITITNQCDPVTIEKICNS